MKRNITMMIVVIANTYWMLTASYKLFQAHHNSSSQQTPWDFINDINLSKDSNLHSLAPEHMKLNILHFFLKRLGTVKSSIILISLAAKGPIAALVSGPSGLLFKCDKPPGSLKNQIWFLLLESILIIPSFKYL